MFYINLQSFIQCPFEGPHKNGGRKPKETAVFEFSYKDVTTSLEELVEIKVIFILRLEVLR